MNHCFGRTLALFLLASIALTGCMGSPDYKPNSAEISARLPMEKDGKYGVESVNLQGITNLETLEGSSVRFLLYPKISGANITGESAHFKFMRSSTGEVIAKDDLSLQALLLTYHFGRLKAFDESVGLQGVLSYPRTVGLALEKDFKIKNNAYYDSIMDAFIFVPFSDPTLPLMANSGVLAHEHFHAIFNSLAGAEIKKALKVSAELPGAAHEVGFFVGRPDDIKVKSEELTEEDRGVYHFLIQRGVNEGLADTWAWIYTGNPDFLALSLPKDGQARSLEKPKNMDLVIDSVEKIQSDVLDIKDEPADVQNRYLSAVAYSYGTQISRHLKAKALRLKVELGVSDQESRLLIAKAIVAVLPEFKKQFVGIPANTYLDTQLIYQLIEKEVDRAK